MDTTQSIVIVQKNCRVDVAYDPEAKVYVGTSTDIPGLVVEAGTIDELLVEIDGAVQSLTNP